MRGEYLENYRARESEWFERYVSRMKSKAASGEELISDFPLRFKKLNKPLVVADISTYNHDKQKIWSQIPFAGTLLILLGNTREENLLPSNGFDKNDIPRLIDLAKEDGRVQFALSAYPENYEGLDYLDPIFQELEPPIYARIPTEIFRTEKEDRKLFISFVEVAKINYANVMSDWYLGIEGENRDMFALQLLNRYSIFSDLKVLGQDDLADFILDKMVDDPLYADQLLSVYSLLTKPLLDGLPASHNMSFKRLHALNTMPDSKKRVHGSGRPLSHAKYPVEIGHFLMNKLAPNASNYQGCRYVIDHYKQNDLYKLLTSLDKGVRDAEKDSVVNSIQELDMVMDNIWKDSERIRKSSKIIQGGLRIGIGLIGFALSSLFLSPSAAAGAGFLAHLGFETGREYLDGKKIGEKVAKSLNKCFVNNIYDFSEKYYLNHKSDD